MPEINRLTFRLPQPMAEQATELARDMGLSLNAYLTLAVDNWNRYQSKIRARQSPPLQPRTASNPPTKFPKVGRNQPCPCGSGEKWKHCHGKT
jgi:uncharacterized protein YecA (UPF0149 family)